MKITHTYHVCKHATALAESLSLPAGEMMFAKIIALLHDVGRFSQYERFRTYADHRSVNHAEESIRVIQEEKIIEKMEKRTQFILLEAIRYHNYPTLPNLPDARLNQHAKILRDADKMDIYRVVTTYYEDQSAKENATIGLDLPHTNDYSESVLEHFLEEKIILSKELKHLNDFKILQLAWVFDLNFPFSIAYIREKRYLSRILKTMPNGACSQQIAEKIETFFSKNQ